MVRSGSAAIEWQPGTASYLIKSRTIASAAPSARGFLVRIRFVRHFFAASIQVARLAISCGCSSTSAAADRIFENLLASGSRWDITISDAGRFL